MNQNILIIDDEPQICELLSIYMRKQGFNAASAGSAKVAFEHLGANPTDVAVLDIGLADEDGLRVLMELKHRHPALKVIMLTGMGLVEDLLQEAVQKGADGYVSKDSPLDELLMAIERMTRPGEPALQGAA